MKDWNNIYLHGSIHEKPSREIIDLVPILREKNVHSILDAGCGTGRHSEYFAAEGFDVHGIDISRQAISIAKKRNGKINYIVGTLTNLSFMPESMDFVLANHSLEYATYADVEKSVIKLDAVLKSGNPLFIRVASTEHPFYHAAAEDIYGFSHIGFCIKNNLPVHFFNEEELRHLFGKYRIERLEHINHKVNHDKITVPLSEWILLGYKK